MLARRRYGFKHWLWRSGIGPQPQATRLASESCIGRRAWSRGRVATWPRSRCVFPTTPWPPPPPPPPRALSQNAALKRGLPAGLPRWFLIDSILAGYSRSKASAFFDLVDLCFLWTAPASQHGRRIPYPGITYYQGIHRPGGDQAACVDPERLEQNRRSRMHLLQPVSRPHRPATIADFPGLSLTIADLAADHRRCAAVERRVRAGLWRAILR